METATSKSAVVNEQRCWAEISLEALRQNARALSTKIGPGARLMAVVKANAYGHGIAKVAQALQKEVGMFGVANLEEGLALSHAGSRAPVLILGPALEWERKQIIDSGFIATVSSFEEALAYDSFGQPSEAHLVIDTGMGRMGVWQEQALEEAKRMLALRHLRITGIATHLPVADEDEDFTARQLSRFETLVSQLRGIGLHFKHVHVLNSAGALAFKEHAQTLVRAGLALYGVSPLPGFQTPLIPVMAWKARVTLVREVGSGRTISYGRTYTTPSAKKVATVAVGYADGYQRHLSNVGAEVLIGGQRCPLLGRVTMDQICVDVSAVPSVAAGDEAVLFGCQGDQQITVTELATKAGTIAWEIFTGIGARVQRVYCP